MPEKRKETMDIREILRRLQKNESDRAVAEAMSIDRKTVGRYHTWANEQGLLEGPLPSLSELHRLLEETMPVPPPPQNVSLVEPHREVVVKLRKQGIEIAAIHERLKERDFSGSYSSVRRFVRNLEPTLPDVTVRVETRPGEEAQADFGYAGRMIDPETYELRKTWVFVMTLSWSRHQYSEFVFDVRPASC
jgi:transposase